MFERTSRFLVRRWMCRIPIASGFYRKSSHNFHVCELLSRLFFSYLSVFFFIHYCYYYCYVVRVCTCFQHSLAIFIQAFRCFVVCFFCYCCCNVCQCEENTQKIDVFSNVAVDNVNIFNSTLCTLYYSDDDHIVLLVTQWSMLVNVVCEFTKRYVAT